MSGKVEAGSVQGGGCGGCTGEGRLQGGEEGNDSHSVLFLAPVRGRQGIGAAAMHDREAKLTQVAGYSS